MEHLPWSTGLSCTARQKHQSARTAREAEVGKKLGQEGEQHWLWSPPLTCDGSQGRIHFNTSLRTQSPNKWLGITPPTREVPGPVHWSLEGLPRPRQSNSSTLLSPPCPVLALWFHLAASTELSDS